MTTSISITYCKKNYSLCDQIRLVRGAGRKTIRVIIFPTTSLTYYDNEEDIIFEAAKLANRKGWRKVVVAPDYFDDTIRVFNLHQYNHEQLKKGYRGVFLGFINYN